MLLPSARAHAYHISIPTQTRELQAAQLLALGVRNNEDNSRKLKLLERLGLVSLANNHIALA